MTEAKIIALRSVEIGVPDVVETTEFFTDVWGLSPVAAHDRSAYLRGTGAAHHIVVLHNRPTPELIRVNLTAPDTAAVDALHEKIKAAGVSEIEAPSALSQPGGGYGFGFKDVEGRNIGIVAEVEDHGDGRDRPDRPRKLSHVVFNSDGAEQSVAFYTDVLGFTVSDRTRMLNFLRCNADHHSIAFSFTGGATLHHIAFEMPDLESVMRGAGRMRENGWEIEWGIGRHGPGNNVFSYFVGPNDMVIEYTAEVMQVDDSYPTGGPDDWGVKPGRSDQWGVTDPPSDRIKAAHGKLGFAEELSVSGTIA